MIHLSWSSALDEGRLDALYLSRKARSLIVFRACPGRFFADASIWLTIANVLAAFEILPPLDPSTGNEVLPKFEYVGGSTA